MEAKTSSWLTQKGKYYNASFIIHFFKLVLFKEDMMRAASTKQVYVSGFDRAGRAIVIYSPISDGSCPTAESVLWLVFNLDR